MAPVEPDLNNSNILPIAAFLTQILLVIGLTATVLHTIRRAARTLPPTSSTRLQQLHRSRDVVIFSILALTSLTVISYFSVEWRRLSYLGWAHSKKYNVPNNLWRGWYGSGDAGVRLRLGAWMKDVNLRREADMIAVKSPSGFLWTHQQFIALVTNSIFIGIEGQRRNLPTATIVSFVLLSQISALSFAQNLFFIVMLFTPVPLYSMLPPRRDPLWTPRPAVYWIPASMSFIFLHLMPMMVGYPWDMPFLTVGYFAVPIFLARAGQILPTSWGHTHKDSRSAHRSMISVFYTIGVFSTFLHFKQLAFAFMDTTPPAKYTDYDYVWDMHRGGERSLFERGSIAIQRLLSTIGDHPAISVTSWDVLLSAISLCMWAFTRRLNVDEMLDCSILSYFSGSKNKDEKVEKHVSFEAESKPTVNSVSPSVSPAKKTRGRPKKGGRTSVDTSSLRSLRRSTRHQAAKHESDSEESFKPSVNMSEEIAKTEHDDDGHGEEDLIAEGEAAALALGLYSIGGLGPLIASVLGAEVGGRQDR